VIKLSGFGWRHAGRRAWAVRGVHLHIEAGERVLLLGPSGAGKSTLLQAMAGLLPADSGESEGEIAVDARVGIVFQDPQSQLVMSRAGDEVAFGLENLAWPREAIWPRVSEVLDGIGFGYPLDRRTDHLSGGEQQRLVLAGALAPRPGLLLLDEPTANLDPAGACLVRQALANVETMVLVEHRVEPFLDLITRVVVLSPGEGVRFDGPPSVLSGPFATQLAAEGVWVPGHPLPHLPAPAGPGETLAAYGDVAVRRGEAVVVTGPNGSGKTTLALTLGGLRPPGNGTVVTAWGDRPHRWRARVLASRIGSVFQNPEHQFVTSSVRAELELGGTPPERVAHLLQRLHLDHLAGANPFTLSGGEARRLSVATALAARPGLLIFDEPTFGQDRRTWVELVSLLASLRDEGHAILAVTHDPHVVHALADRTVAL
jgi:energy-coupling factor transport system ATP-binding protein